MRWQITFRCALILAAIVPRLSGQSLLKADEATWAKRLRLQQSYVSKIVQAAGFSEDDEIRIEKLDLQHLSSRGHVLLVTAAGNGHCLKLTVLARKENFVRRVWRTSVAPGGAGFCHAGAYSGDFQAHATSNGTIVVEVPRYAKGGYVLPGVRRLVYKWDGQKYAVNQESER
jgi:hypothetical protein